MHEKERTGNLIHPTPSRELVDILTEMKRSQDNMSSSLEHVNESLRDLSMAIGNLISVVEENLHRSDLMRETLKHLINQQRHPQSMHQSSSDTQAHDIPSTSSAGIFIKRELIEGSELAGTRSPSASPSMTVRNVYSPNCMDGNDDDTYFLGGIEGMDRPRDVYDECLKEIQSHKKKNDEDRGRMLCLSLLRKEFSQEDLRTKNVTGVKRSSDRKKTIAIGKLDEVKLKAIFYQASMQFPGFADKPRDTKCKTVIAIQDHCKRMRKATVDKTHLS